MYASPNSPPGAGGGHYTIHVQSPASAQQQQQQAPAQQPGGPVIVPAGMMLVPQSAAVVSAPGGYFARAKLSRCGWGCIVLTVFQLIAASVLVGVGQQHMDGCDSGYSTSYYDPYGYNYGYYGYTSYSVYKVARCYADADILRLAGVGLFCSAFGCIVSMIAAAGGAAFWFRLKQNQVGQVQVSVVATRPYFARSWWLLAVTTGCLIGGSVLLRDGLPWATSCLGSAYSWMVTDCFQRADQRRYPGVFLISFGCTLFLAITLAWCHTESWFYDDVTPESAAVVAPSSIALQPMPVYAQPPRVQVQVQPQPQVAYGQPVTSAPVVMSGAVAADSQQAALIQQMQTSLMLQQQQIQQLLAVGAAAPQSAAAGPSPPMYGNASMYASGNPYAGSTVEGTVAPALYR